MSPINEWFIGAIVLAVFVFWFLKRSSNNHTQLPETLDTLNDDYQVIENLMLMTKSGVWNIDFLVLSPYGVFIIKTLGSSGTLIADDKKGDWAIKSLGRSENIANPIWENKKLVNVLDNWMPNVPWYHWVVTTSAIKGKGSPFLISPKELRSKIIRPQTKLIPDKTLAELSDKLTSNKTLVLS